MADRTLLIEDGVPVSDAWPRVCYWSLPGCKLDTAAAASALPCTCSREAGDARRVREVLRRCGALPAERERSAFDARSLEQDLARLLRGGSVEQHRAVLDLPLARPALAGALLLLTVCLAAPADSVQNRAAERKARSQT